MPDARSKEFASLVERLLGEDEHDRYNAGSTLQRLGRKALSVAFTLAEDPRHLARSMACFVLGQVHDPALGHEAQLRDGLPVLMRLLEHDPEPEVRASAAAALGHQQAFETIPLLCRMAADPSEDVRFDVAFALGRFYGSCWEEDPTHRNLTRETLLRLSHDPDEDVRDWATFGLRQGDHDSPEVRDRLLKALEDSDGDVRAEAAAGLSEFGDRRVIPHLDRLLREDPAVSSLYFDAAERLADPSLLPAVRIAAERWKSYPEEDEFMDLAIASAIVRLEALVPGDDPSA